MESGDESSRDSSPSPRPTTMTPPPYYPEPPRIPIESLGLVRTPPAAANPHPYPRNPAIVYRYNGVMPPSNPRTSNYPTGGGMPSQWSSHRTQHYQYQKQQQQPLWRPNQRRTQPPTNQWTWGTPQQQRH